MITVIGNMKGGTGKSTVTFNLALWLAYQEKTLRLFDLDPQQTLSDVIEVRREEAFEPLLPLPQHSKDLATLAEQEWDETLIDVSMSDQDALLKALQQCHRVLVPVAPSQADIWSTQRFLKLIKTNCPNHKPEVFGVLNRADTHPQVVESKETEEALDFLPGIKRLPTRLYNRTAYRRSFSEGMAVFELNPNGKASKEIVRLGQDLYNS